MLRKEMIQVFNFLLRDYIRNVVKGITDIWQQQFEAYQPPFIAKKLKSQKVLYLVEIGHSSETV